MSSIPPTTAPTPATRWIPTRNVLALAAVSFLTDASSEIIAPLLPLFLVGTLGATVSMVGVIEGGAEAVASLLKLASGWWSDRVSRRKPLIVAGYTIASLVRPLVAIAQSATQVLAIRLVDRVGKGIRGAPRDALLAASTPLEFRGRAFGFHRAADHAGAVVGPLIALACLQWLGMPIRHVFWVAAIPGALAVMVAIAFVREQREPAVPRVKVAASPTSPASALPRSFWLTMVPILVFTLGNSTDAFLLLRASQLGVPTALIPLVWVLLHLVKSASSTPAGALSDRVGRRPLIVAGWGLYAAVYAGFSLATEPWHAWALFGVYGVVFGLTEGTEKALVADLVPAARRGTAFGWYQATVGVAALPASIVFGVVWDRLGSPTAFGMGAALAIVAAVIMSLVPLTPAEA
ncbi:MFS transporter [Gemmatimonas groenlandica]|uniref:MFS transporter n=1 Tax=Gemmatimonas groenlandica TaxID=2732249 RepID=A0A6M4IQ33_9BACT|nr:MFS transporter [Gemmatimonas groenlandica]QJR34391.1 MFS transporter [Gemmatimonas groenlandica]